MYEPGFFAYAQERYNVYLNKTTGEPWPWTRDTILQQYRFCNVFREDDKTTKWFNTYICNPVNRHGTTSAVILATVAFRWFNRIETWETVLHALTREESNFVEFFNNYDGEFLRKVLLRDGKAPWTTGSYIIKTPDGMDKLHGVLHCIETFRNMLARGDLQAMHWRGSNFTLEDAWTQLRKVPFLGDFMAYEVVTDLRHTHVLCNAPDIMTWANPGPGAARGYSRIMGKSPDYYGRHSATDRHILMEGMKRLLELAQLDKKMWPNRWPKWEMRDVEHTLCEYDKYMRVANGEGRPRQIYRRVE